jgi:hypothetical protein
MFDMKTLALRDVIIFSTNNLQVHSKQNEKPSQMPISPVGIMKRLTTHADGSTDISLPTVGTREPYTSSKRRLYTVCVNYEKISEQSIQNFCHEKDLSSMISILWISKGCSFLFHVLLWTTALC